MYFNGLYLLKLHNVVCQLYFNKAGRKRVPGYNTKCQSYALYLGISSSFIHQCYLAYRYWQNRGHTENGNYDTQEFEVYNEEKSKLSSTRTLDKNHIDCSLIERTL